MPHRYRVFIRAVTIALTLLTSLTVTASRLGATPGRSRAVVAPVAPPAVAPTDITASAGSGRVTVTWAPVPGATGYRLLRAVAGMWETVPFVKITSTAYTNTGLANGVAYGYRVAAVNAGGTGPYSLEASATPLAAPTALVATPGNTTVALAWAPVTGASSYTVFRGTTSTASGMAVVGQGLAAPAFADSGLTNQTYYYYRVRADGPNGSSALSVSVKARPMPPPPSVAPDPLTGAAGNGRASLTWTAVPGVSGYKIYRTTTGVFDTPPIASTASTSYTNTGLVNGTTYLYTVAGYGIGGIGPQAVPVSVTPLAPPPAPTGLTATAGDHQVSLSWDPTPGAASYDVFRSATSGRQGRTPILTGLTVPSFTDTNLENGPTVFYKVRAVNGGGAGALSAEASASPEGSPLVVTPETTAAFQLLRHATWGPRPQEIALVAAGGPDAFIASQMAVAPSDYPDALMTQPVESVQEQMMANALSGGDQLRQRVAWALHKIWVVSAVEVGSSPALVTYHRLLLRDAFSNYRDLMRDLTLNPAMGSFLDMLDNRSQAVSGVPPNENYARELMQLFTLGIPTLNPDGTPALVNGQQVPAYTEQDVKELARMLTGWTFGDGDPATVPRWFGRENYRVPMENVARYHDSGAKRFLGTDIPAGQTADQDLQQALDLLFAHPNVGPFVSRQLIQQLVTSNPSPAYVASVAAVFADNGGVRGDLAAVVRAILTHPEATATTTTNGKLSEPALFVVSILRGLGANVADHPFMSDRAEQMGQKVLYPPSVFSYFSPGYRVAGTRNAVGAPLAGPEFQILTAVTALERANFVADLLGGHFGTDVIVDLSPFSGLARDPGALVDACNLQFMGGRMSPEERAEIMVAVRATPQTNLLERARTALYLTLVAAQSQIDR
ncbi:MAG: DUF1800 family protein [Vicinamibacterales bacterium]